MYFDSLHALLTMDGHGAYVWTAYGVTVAVIAATLFAPLRRSRRFLLQLRGEPKRAQGAPSSTARDGR
jgi:heme exporter protein D